MPTPRVILVEDNLVYRQTLELLLPPEGIDVVGVAGDAEDAVGLAAALVPDVVLLDVRLPGLSGAEAVDALRAAAPTAAIVCLTGEATHEQAEAARASGALTVIDKATPTRQLADAIRSAARRCS